MFDASKNPQYLTSVCTNAFEGILHALLPFLVGRRVFRHFLLFPLLLSWVSVGFGGSVAAFTPFANLRELLQ